MLEGLFELDRFWMELARVATVGLEKFRGFGESDWRLWLFNGKRVGDEIIKKNERQLTIFLKINPTQQINSKD